MNANRGTLVLLVASSALMAQQHAVVPTQHAVVDGSHTFFVAGTYAPERQLTLIDGSLLTPTLGRAIHALAFRRNAEADEFAGGSAHLTVRMSHAARSWQTASPVFEQNHGPDVTTVFQGTVTLPTSPGTTTNQITWLPTNTFEVLFQVPFAYVGGTIAIEVSGQPDPTQPAEWWPADAAWEPSGGSEVSIGNGCGPFGGPTGEWSFLTATNLTPGGSAVFSALGTPGDLAYWLLAARTQPMAVDLSPFGASGCYAHLNTPIDGLMTTFASQLRPSQPALGALAQIHVPLPASTMFLGAAFASQWFGLGAVGITTSNAHAWSIAAQQPGLPMTLVTAHDNGARPTSGRIVPGCGHVFRFAF